MQAINPHPETEWKTHSASTHSFFTLHTHTHTFTVHICAVCSYMPTSTHTALWLLWCATPLSFPCMLAVPSGWRWLMTAMERQIIWVASSTQDVNQISFTNDSQALIWQPRPELYRVSNEGTKKTSISPRMILFDHQFQGLMSISSWIPRWQGAYVCRGKNQGVIICTASQVCNWCVCSVWACKLYGYACI